jgi:hypothetical protein
MASFCLWLWGIIMVFGVLFWRRYPPGHEFRRVSLVLMVVATIVAAGILPIFAIADREDTRQACGSQAARAPTTRVAGKSSAAALGEYIAIPLQNRHVWPKAAVSCDFSCSLLF